MKENEKEAVLEAVLFAMGEAVSLEKLSAAVESEKEETREILEKMKKGYQKKSRGIQLIEMDGSFQLCTKPVVYDALSRVVQVPQKYVLTDVLLETLSIIAYRQPVTRVEIEKIRGVKCDHAVNKLVEYDLVEEVGRLDVPGKPILFGTTEEFLRHFGVDALDALPEMDMDKKMDFQMEAEEEVRIRLEGEEET